jgi:glycosyltransferase involved in cell wall biosynthesis
VIASLKALVFAALPPPIGGVSSIVLMLRQSLAGESKLGFASPAVKKDQLNGVLRPIINLWRLGKSALTVVRGGRLMFFSSAGASFYEKLAWIVLLQLFGRKAVMVMVDGNFPAFWERMPRLFRKFAQILVESSSMTVAVQSKQWLYYYKTIFPNSSCSEIGATVSTEFRVAQPWEDPISVQTVLYVGWMIPGKGVGDLLEAFKLVRSSCPNARLRMVGPLFNAGAYWQKELMRLDIGSCVDFVGPIHDRTHLIKMLHEATIFVLPSHAEGLPVALIEAMTLGVPCVGTDVGGIRDLLDNGAAGVVVPPHNPVELAKALQSLLLDQTQRGRLSRNALERARSVYGEDAFTSSYRSILGL